MRHGRDEPPTRDEMLAYVKSQEALKERVRKLEEADRKLRFQEQIEKKLRGGTVPRLWLCVLCRRFRSRLLASGGLD
jgi:hypothetical protein